MAVSEWSIVASDNNAAPPTGAPEGIAPSSVNNVLREMMASVRALAEELPYFDYGDTPTRIDSDTFTLSSDRTAIYAVGRRLKLVGVTTGYGTVSAVSYSTPTTTIEVVMDSGGVPSSLFRVAVTDPVVTEQTEAERLAAVTPINTRLLPGNVLRYGINAVPGSTNMTAAFQAAVNSSPGIFIPQGEYLISSTVNLKTAVAQIIRGEGRNATTIRSPAGVNTFKWQASGNDLYGPIIEDMYINSDYPIRINDLTTFIDISNATGDAAVLACRFRNLLLISRSANLGVTGVGQGITAAKMFDSTIERCELWGYQDCIYLHGSDINTVRDNRIELFSRFGICDQSAATFGSQNDISHNDILASAGTTATYIKTNSLHVSIHDNYLEKPGGTCFAFVDATGIGMPVLGTNVSSKPWSVSIVDNRCDGEPYCTHTYRIDPAEAVSIRCVNRNTTAAGGGPSSFSGSVFPYPNPSGGKQRYIEIQGLSWGVWDGYRTHGNFTAGSQGIACTGEHLRALILKDQTQNITVVGKKYVVPAAFTGLAWVVPGEGLANNLFASGGSYTLSVIARSTSASGDTLVAGMGSNGHGDIAINCALTNQFKRFDIAFSGRAISGFDNFGCYLQRLGSSGDIEITSVGFTMTP